MGLIVNCRVIVGFNPKSLEIVRLVFHWSNVDIRVIASVEEERHSFDKRLDFTGEVDSVGLGLLKFGTANRLEDVRLGANHDLVGSDLFIATYDFDIAIIFVIVVPIRVSRVSRRYEIGLRYDSIVVRRGRHPDLVTLCGCCVFVLMVS
jgi:hypothetical protein